MTDKLVVKKYDPVAKKHVEFREGKIKASDATARDDGKGAERRLFICPQGTFRGRALPETYPFENAPLEPFPFGWNHPHDKLFGLSGKFGETGDRRAASRRGHPASPPADRTLRTQEMRRT
jgi:hypothetical protein